MTDLVIDSNNALYIEALYQAYLEDPNTVPDSWKRYFDTDETASLAARHTTTRSRFEQLGRNKSHTAVIANGSNAVNTASDQDKQVKVLQLINSYRQLGHLVADTNILESDEKRYVPELTLGYHGLAPEDLERPFHTGSMYANDVLPLKDIVAQLEQVYCQTVGSQYMYITNIAEKRWLQARIEGRKTNALTVAEKKNILHHLIAADMLERYLHRQFVGKKRFSLEGGDALIPLLHTVIQHSGAAGTQEIVLGMAHRGRLNVLINIMGKAPATLFEEFKGKMDNGGRSGDVKYHLGYSSDIVTPGGNVHLSLAFNPSHLEIVGPVVEGSVRARQDRRDENSATEVIPVIIHGDAALAGQGVNMEMLNMSETRGYRTHGSIHIVINNQIGFTTSTKQDSRSTEYCTDLMKMVSAPVFHVNSDDPEAIVEVTRAAIDYRMEFHKDVIIDMVCYRRHGHNEADEPSATQPLMYKRIKQLKTPQQRYAERLINAGVLTAADVKALEDEYKEALESGEPTVSELLNDKDYSYEYMVDWKRYKQDNWRSDLSTNITEEQYERLGLAMAVIPEGFKMNGRVGKIADKRREMAKGVEQADWGFGENLAYAGLLDEGYSVRLSGEDCQRGTFFHRHAAFHEQNTGEVYLPLKKVGKQEKDFVVIDSLLSEEAVLAFEYGYATTEPEKLVIWEAQFGDFANGAQMVIDQFISSAEQKWGLANGMVMLLPHGYEGMGPEHSSARLERFMQLCAQENMQVCIPSTPAQVFHMLRRQMIRQYRKPLIVMTPKSLLRHPLAVSDKHEFTDGGFQCVLDEIDDLDKDKVDRVIICSGKVYYELIERRRKEHMTNVAIIRLEQLYPFPDDELYEVVSRYTNARRFVWCQEEPYNQGAWLLIQPMLQQVVGDAMQLDVVSRQPMAAPAEGLHADHVVNQARVIERALNIRIRS